MFKKLIYFMSFGLVLGVSAGVANADIIAFWPFDEGSGDVAKDVVGGHDAQLTGIDWVPGQFGGSAVESSRGSDEIFVGPGPTPAGEDLSIAWWMVDTYDSWHTMMNKYETSSVAGNGILLRPTSEDSPLRWRLGGWQAYGGWGQECRVAQGTYSDGEWTHVACTYDSASDTATIYVNGELPANGNFNPKTGIAGPGGYTQGVNDPAQPLVIVGQQETYGGILDDVAIWDHPLTADEVLSVFALGPLALDPRTASRPNPANEADDIARDLLLAWTPGESAVSHNVFMGTSFADANGASVADPLGAVVGQDLGTSEWDPGRLEFGQTYYWRVDEVNGAPDFTTFKGTVWSFTAEPFSIPISGIMATASSAFGLSVPENTINGSGLVDDLHGTTSTDMWISGGIPATLEYTFDRAYKLHELWIWNGNQTVEPFVGFGAKDVVIEYSLDGENWTILDGVGPLAQGPGAAGYVHNNTIDFGGATAQHVRVIVNSVQGIAPQASLSEVRFFYIPTYATRPNPAPDATNVAPDVVLSWGRDGREAGQHEIYLGSDPANMTLADTVTESSFATLALDLQLGQTYSWRVDEVNDAMDPSTWTGDLWNFTTVEAITVDDMESYKDEALLEIWATWVDGFEDPANGSLVGNGATGSPETGIVHGGGQSLPLHYGDGGAAQSEATRTFAAAQDWTRHGVQSLALHFQGTGTNTGGSLYVKINDTKVSYDGDADSLMRGGWNKWVILLGDLAGADLSNVRSLTVGVEGGGDGVVYVDDISLTPAGERDLVTPTEPVEGLVLYLPFDGDYQDASGNGLHGTPMGFVNPPFAAGHMGQAASLDGIDQYVEITGYKGILADADEAQNPFTLSAWIKTTANGEIITWGAAPARQRMTFRVDTVLRVEHGGGNVRGTNGSDLRDDQWHHVAATIPQNARMMDVTLYVDGADVTPGSTSTAAFNLTGDTDVSIGRRATSNDRFFLGSIDEVRIFDRVLSAGEVAGLAGRTQPFDRP